MEKHTSAVERNQKISNSVLNAAIFFIFITKIIVSGWFSSGFMLDSFLPFVTAFVTGHIDPWQYVFTNKPEIVFPYPPLMLYLLAPGAALVHFGAVSDVFWVNIFSKIPIFIADIAILWMLCQFRPQAKGLFVAVYFLSPVVFFAAYLQGQLDLIPVAFLLASVFLLLRPRFILSLLAFTAALLCKTTAIVALPFLLIFLYRKHHWQAALVYLVLAAVLYIVASMPYLLHESYIQIVLNNPQQAFIFNSGYPIGNLQLFPVILLMLVIFAHFMLYKKINNDLLLSYLSLAFSVFLIFAYPVPTWFVWIIPFLSLFLVAQRKERRVFLALYAGFSLIYIVFFLFFYRYPLNPEMPSLIFLNKPFLLNIQFGNMKDIIFTLLAGMLAIQVYLNYRYSIRSNAIYKNKNHATIVGISGDSGSGKSRLLGDLFDLLGSSKVTHLEGDGEHRWERGHENWKKHTHLDPKANLLHQQADALEQLKQGLCIYRRDYDHHTGKFTDARPVKTNDYILIAGLHTFYLPKSRKLVDIKIFINTDEKLRKHWKILRDRANRGYTRDQVLKSLEQRAPDREKFIVPQKQFADICFRYFTDSKFEEGDESITPEVKLSAALSANINLEKMYQLLSECNHLIFEYDYSEDLHTQEIIFSGTISSAEIGRIAANIIDNLEELVNNNAAWQEGLRGLHQLMVLMVVSHHLKERSQ